MQPHMEKPAYVARAVPVSDLAGASIDPELTPPLRKLQARSLTRRCAISFAMASVVAALLHGESFDGGRLR
jgi:hypothetical protein